MSDKRVKIKNGRDYSPEAARAAALETQNASAFASQWLTANVTLSDITSEDGHVNQDLCQRAAAAGFMFAKIVLATQGHYYNDAIEEAEEEILNGEFDASRPDVAAERKTKGGIILPTTGMMRDRLRPDQLGFIDGAGGLKL